MWLSLSLPSHWILATTTDHLYVSARLLTSAESPCGRQYWLKSLAIASCIPVLTKSGVGQSGKLYVCVREFDCQCQWVCCIFFM